MSKGYRSKYFKLALKELAYKLFAPRIELGIRDGRLTGRARGLTGPIFQPLLDKVVEKQNKAKPIAIENGSFTYTLYHPPYPSSAANRAIQALVRDKLFGIKTPTTCTLAVTYKCQCRCVHCSADRFIDPNRRELSTDELKSVIDQSLDLGVVNVVFTGGEPMLRRDIYELIAHVDKTKAHAMMFTNGWFLSEENVKRLKDAGLHSLNISIDHLNARIHDDLRRLEGCYARAFEGAARAREAGILTGISTYATKDNLRDGSLEGLLQLAQREGFHEVTIFDCMPAGRFLREESVLLSPAERAEIVKMARRYVAMDHPMGVIAQSWINSPIGSGCFGGQFQFYMTAYGDINPCDFNPVTFGNVREMPLRDIWRKMITHPEYEGRKRSCRIQNPYYRAHYIRTVSDSQKLPIPIEQFEPVRVQDVTTIPELEQAKTEEPAKAR